MTYAQATLTPGEKIAYTARLHWIVFCSVRAVLSLFLMPLIEQWTTELVITNKRVVAKTGLISRRTIELNLTKVESIQVIQTILGRLLGYGTVVLIGSGGTREVFANVERPLVFRREYQRLLP